MIQNVPKDLKDKFIRDYSSKIANLGYNLSVGVGCYSKGSKGPDTIEARILSEETIPTAVKKQIEDIIPKMYLYWEEKIPVKLLYMHIPIMY